ncbi:helix-turn-helix protein [Bacteroides heparinolyticus]|uniref:Helix-turn-helix protein n=2 Tax=Prevotella heparinolytica TaxID=28113 RepID=A0A4R2LE18_9BACE|nr:helix-turn-helix protein [Bacteroides heparinolyticus]
MRTKEEIRQAIEVLSYKNDKLSRAMAEVLRSGKTERQVFEHYVMNTPEAMRDEAVFFAARDAARFAKGHLGMEVLVPDASTVLERINARKAAEEVPEGDAGAVVLSRADFDKLMARIERLEQWTGLRRKAKPGKCLPGTLPADADMADMMTQNEACRYLKCGKNTIKGYASRGLIHSYKQGRYTYYSRREMERNIIGQREEESL